jgi:hypothetical protein
MNVETSSRAVETSPLTVECPLGRAPPTMNITTALLVGSLAFCAGCASLTPAGATVRHVAMADASAVRTCRPIGKVVSSPPYALPDEWRIQLRNQTAQLGGDTVVSGEPGLGTVEGMAFRCRP